MCGRNRLESHKDRDLYPNFPGSNKLNACFIGNHRLRTQIIEYLFEKVGWVQT